MNIKQDGITPNASRLLWAGFMAILAAGVGFGVRGGILATWGADFGFSAGQLGAIGGAGFTGFCFGIVIGGVICDRIGYGPLILSAFLFHVISAFVTFGATSGQEQATAYQFLYWGTFIFALANGTLEAVANPLVATLFPNNRTHYLNILHASWPAGMVIGGVIGWTLGGTLSWQMQLALFLGPTLLYGIMFLGQKMPKSAASEKGLGLGEMFRDVGVLGGLVISFLLVLFFGGALAPLFEKGSSMPDYFSYGIGGVCLIAIALITNFSLGSFLLFVLFIVHAMVGAVELGTDGWIQNITGNILTPDQGKILFVYTSLVMFSLRFCADFIERKLGLSPVGILVVCSILACIGLNLASGIETFIGAILALTVYAVGKTFFWPTMLAVASDRFPKTGAVAISIMGGIGMMSAGLIGNPGLGYAKDRFAGEALEAANTATYATYKAEKPSEFLFFEPKLGLDGTKFGVIQKKLETERAKLEESGSDNLKDAEKALAPAELEVVKASITGDRKTLTADSTIPALMAVIYILLMIYFKSIGGYRVVKIGEEE